MTIQSGYTKAAADNWDAAFGLGASDPEVDFWMSDEETSNRDKDEAIEDRLDTLCPGPGDPTPLFDALPKTIEIEGYRVTPIEPTPAVVGNVLDRIYEDVDDNYPREWAPSPTVEIENMAMELMKTIYRQCGVCDWHLVRTETVDVQQWVRDNRPDWLEP